MKDGEFSASCKSCGCTVSVQFNVTMPASGTAADAGPEKEADAKPSEALPGTLMSPRQKRQDQSDETPAKEGQPSGKKQLNVFGPAALALGALTVIFAFIAGLKALVLGIPALIVCGLGFLACYLVKNMKKWMSAAGIIMTAAGIIIAAIMREGIIF